MRTNYMMTVDDVMEELGVKRSKAYSILKQLNDELVKEGYVAVRGKIPRPLHRKPPGLLCLRVPHSVRTSFLLH